MLGEEGIFDARGEAAVEGERAERLREQNTRQRYRHSQVRFSSVLPVGLGGG